MTTATRSLRLLEMTLWAAGVTLLGVVLVATLTRWNYQLQQERVLFQRGPAVSADAVQAVAVNEETPEPAVLEPPPAPPAALAPAKKKPRAVAPDPTAFGRIEIPRLRIAAIVKEGDDEKTLSRAVGLIDGSPRPGDPGNVVLAGHRDTFFRPLRKIDLKDRIRLVVPPHTYEYEVQSVDVVAPENTRVLESRGVEELTLVTCYPFDLLGPAPDRFIVRAARVH